MQRKPDGWALALGLAALSAFLLRLHAINFGLPGLDDPDELMFEMGAIRMLSHATLNPGWFGHPATTTMYGLALVNISVFGVGHLAGWYPTLKSFGAAVYADPGVIILPGRVLMALFGAGTVWQTGLLGRDLFNRRVGLVAACVVAISPLCVYWGQVIRSDIMGSFFILLAMRAMLHGENRPGWRADAVVAFWLGVAIATKWPMGLAGLAMAGLVARRILGKPETALPELFRLARCGVMSALFTLMASPYLLLAHETVLRNLQGEAQAHHLGATGGTPLENLGWYLRGPLADGLGWPGLVLAAIGLVLVFRHADRRAAWLLSPVLLAMGVVICLQHLVWDRWALPLLPLLAIPVGLAASMLFERLQGHLRWLVPIGLVAAAIPMELENFAHGRERMNDTRQRAGAWAVGHLPAGSSVLVEHFAFDIYPQPWRFLFPIGEAGCVDVRALLLGKAGYNVIDSARGTRSNVDYGTMPARLRGGCHTDFAILTQYDRYGAEKQDFPEEYAAYRELLARGTIVASFYPQPGVSAGPVVRIVDFRHGKGG